MKFLKSNWTIGVLQLIFVIAVISLAFLVVSALSKIEDKRSPISPDIAEHNAVSLTVVLPEMAPYQPVLSLNGVVKTQTEVSLAAQVGGKVISVSDSFRPGGIIARNDVLFSIDPSDFKLNVEAANAEIAAAQSSLTQLEAEAKLAIEEWNALYPGEKISDLAAKRPQIAAAKARLQSAEAARKQAELALSRTTVRAPSDMRILATQLTIGQIIAPNQSVGRGYPLQGVEISATASQAELSIIAPVVGRSVDIAGRSGSSLDVKGVVVRRDAALDERTRLANLYIRPETYQDLSVGEFVSVRVAGDVVEDAMRIPKSAFSRKGEVWVVANGRLAPRLVIQIGETETQFVVRRFHVADGLVAIPPGDSTEGMEVNIRSGAEE